MATTYTTPPTFTATVVSVADLNAYLRDNVKHLYESKGNPRAVASKSTTYTATVTDGLLLCTGTFTVTLPAAATVGAEFSLVIKNVGTGIVTVDGNGSETIFTSTAVANLTLTPGQAVTVISDGTNFVAASDAAPGAVRVLARAVAQQDVTNTITETTVFTHTVKAGTLGTSSALRLTLIGDYYNNTGTGPTSTIRVKYGSTTIYTQSDNITHGANRGGVLLSVVLSAANATNAQRVSGWCDWSSSSVNNAGGTAGTPTYHKSAVHNSVAEDSTTDLAFAVTFQHGATDANLSLRMHAAVLEHITA